MPLSPPASPSVNRNAISAGAAVPIGRSGHVAGQVVFLDGLTGSGKTMLGPVLTSFARVESQRIESVYEYVCALRFLGHLTDAAAQVLIRMHSDIAAYHMSISREVNFRWGDLTCVLTSPGGWRYVRRLLQRDGAAAMARIAAERPVLHVLSHQVLPIAQPLFDAFGHRLTLIEMVRHPLQLLRHWYSYIDRHGSDPRDFTVWITDGQAQLPWFAHGWEEAYRAGTRMDRVIGSIDWLLRRGDQALAELDPSQRGQVVVIPFEQFVTDPGPWIGRIEAALQTTRTAATARVLRQQKIPRRLTADGLDLAIYRRYDWQPPQRAGTELRQLRAHWEFAANEASPDALARLEALCADYEQRYWRPGGACRE